MPRLIPTLTSLLLASRALAATVSVNWDVTWVNASPDGFERPVIGINNAWPCPTLEAFAGDTIQLTINNKLDNQTTGLHFHGIDQILTEDMDGPSGVTQCPVPPGSSITYTFVVSICLFSVPTKISLTNDRQTLPEHTGVSCGPRSLETCVRDYAVLVTCI